MAILGFTKDPATGEYVTKITAPRSGLAPGLRFFAAIALLGVVMFSFPKAALPLGVLLVLVSLASSGANPAAPIKMFGRLIYGD